VTTDILGNVMAVVNLDAPMRVMYAGHMDEIGFIVHYIDKDGFLFFRSIWEQPRSLRSASALVCMPQFRRATALRQPMTDHTLPSLQWCGLWVKVRRRKG
jgi:hypothetical protein